MHLIRGIDNFVKDSSAPLPDFLEADEIVTADGFALSGIISEVSENGVAVGLGPAIQGSIISLANAVQLTAIRFLSAWVALNCSDNQLCLDECEKITEPFASVYTLIGQASLELGDIADAIDALNVATSLDPAEPMSWFQLAKAHHIAGEQSKSWDALDRTEHLTGPDLEVRSMRAFVALSEPKDQKRLEIAWDKLLAITKGETIHPGLAILLFELSFARSDLEGTGQVINGLEPAAAATDQDFRGNLSRILRRLHEFGRMDLATNLLDRIISAAPENKKGA